MSDESTHPNDQPTADVPIRAEAGEDASTTRWLRTPPIDIFETDEGLVLRADLPNISAESLDLQVQDNKLTLFGRAQLSEFLDESRLVHQEFHVGDFLRSFIISDDVDHERISAKLNDGVLELRLPRAPRTQPRQIQVRTE